MDDQARIRKLRRKLRAVTAERDAFRAALARENPFDVLLVGTEVVLEDVSYRYPGAIKLSGIDAALRENYVEPLRRQMQGAQVGRRVVMPMVLRGGDRVTVESDGAGWTVVS